MPEISISYSYFEAFLRELTEIGKTLSGIRADLQTINETLEKLDYTMIRVH
jgi:hypothetical protein